MWNFKNLLFGLLMAVCSITCIITVVFNIESDFGIMGFAETASSFAPTGIVVFTFAAFIFLKNAKR